MSSIEQGHLAMIQVANNGKESLTKTPRSPVSPHSSEAVPNAPNLSASFLWTLRVSSGMSVLVQCSPGARVGTMYLKGPSSETLGRHIWPGQGRNSSSHSSKTLDKGRASEFTNHSWTYHSTCVTPALCIRKSPSVLQVHHHGQTEATATELP